MKRIIHKMKKKSAEQWARKLIKNLMEQQEKEDYLYHYRWEFVNEESKQYIFRLFPLWAAQVYGCSKEEMEVLYRKGYRYIRRLEPEIKVMEVRKYDLTMDEVVSGEEFLGRLIPEIIIKTVQEDRFPSLLLEEYEQLSESLKEMVRCELFGELMEHCDEKEQEQFLQKTQQLFPAFYWDWMNTSVDELLFCTRGKIESCTKYMERYCTLHKADKELMQRLEEHLVE